jgi:hypothetical protein
MGDFLFLFFLSFRASITYVRRHLKWNVFSFFLPLCVFNVFCIETAYAMEAEAESETDSEASVGFANDQLVYKGLYLPLKTPNSREYPLDFKKLKGFEDDFTLSTPL